MGIGLSEASFDIDSISQTGYERDEFGVAIGGCAADSFKMEEIQVC